MMRRCEKVMKTIACNRKFKNALYMLGAVIMVAFMLMLGSFSMRVEASTGKAKSNANVRSSASTQSEAIASLSQGDTFEIKGQTNGNDGYIWYEISVNATQTGYVRSDLVEITDGTTPANNDSTNAATQTTQSVNVNSDGITEVETVSGMTNSDVNVRADASTNSEIVAKVQNGLTLSVTGTKMGTDGNTWYYLTFSKDGVSTTGYIRSDFVNLSGELKEPQAEDTPEPVQNTTETTTPTVQKKWDTQEQADGWFLLDYENGKQYNIDNIFQTNDDNTAKLEDQKEKIKSLRTGLIIVIVLLVVAIAAAVFFFMKWKDLDDRAAFAEAEKERAKRIAGQGDGRRPAKQVSGRPSREPGKREVTSGERRRPDGASGSRPQGGSDGSGRRPAEPQRGQSTHTVKPSEGSRRPDAPSRDGAGSDGAAGRSEGSPEPQERRRVRPQPEAMPKEHRKKPPVDDDDDEFEFGFLNWDDDDNK